MGRAGSVGSFVALTGQADSVLTRPVFIVGPGVDEPMLRFRQSTNRLDLVKDYAGPVNGNAAPSSESCKSGYYPTVAPQSLQTKCE